MRGALVSLSAMGLLIGCSDATAPAPGTFRAQLSGARMEGLSGDAIGSALFSVKYPDSRFFIQMFDTDGEETRSLVLHCPGESPPAAGSYNVSTAEAECGGTYSRVRASPEGGTVLEQAEASSGRLTISALDAGELSGSFNFEGILVVGSDSAGTLDAKGFFSSTIGP